MIDPLEAGTNSVERLDEKNYKETVVINELSICDVIDAVCEYHADARWIPEMRKTYICEEIN